MRILARLLALTAVLALFVGFSPADDKPGRSRKDNRPPKGFKALFNGKDLTGWQAAIQIDKRLKMDASDLAKAQAEANSKVLPHWSVKNGELVNDGKGGNLATVKDFQNFELLADWNIEPKGDSGIYLRGLPQVQIWDSDSLDRNARAKDFGKGSGALWNNKKDNVPLKNADKAPGEWNSFLIVMKGDKVTVRLNGETVVDQVALENLWQPNEPLPAAGPIELQQHPKQDGTHGKIRFKNIYIKELPD
jgi:hypothetical protein